METSCTLDLTSKPATLTNLPDGCQTQCRGCPHRALTQEQSHFEKQTYVQKSLQHFQSSSEKIRFNSNQNRWGNRNRVVLRSKIIGHQWKFGFLDREQNLINLESCPSHSPFITSVVQLLSKILPIELPLAFLVINEQIITLVLKKFYFDPGLEFLSHELKQIGVDALWLNFNPSCGERVLNSKAFVRVFGHDHSIYKSNILKPFYYGPSSFLQNDLNLYADALGETSHFFAPSPHDCIIDLYCGIGLSVRQWLEDGATVLGVELHGESLKCAQKNTQNQGNAAFLRGRTQDRVPQIESYLNQYHDKNKKLFINPPRMGIDDATLKFILAKQWSKIAYLSCNPKSLAPDLTELTQNHYKINKIIPYDFIPNTLQVETLVLLEKSNH